MTDLTDLTRFTSGSIAGRAERLPGPLRELHRAVLRRFLEDCGTDCGSFQAMCPNTAFHASPESARAYLASHPGLDGQVLGQDTAIECGRLNFGTLLTGPA